MGAHGVATRTMSAVLVLLGLAMVVIAIARGGGPLSIGVLVGLLFCLAGGGRLHLSRDA